MHHGHHAHIDETITSGEHMTFWIDSVKQNEYAVLDHDIETEVLVIGGGISGLTTAYRLLEAGHKVVLVEDGLIGSGESGRTTAHITYALDDRFFYLIDLFGEEKMKLYTQSHNDAIDHVEEIVNKEKIDCDFRRIDGHLFLHESDRIDSLKKEFDATQKLGLPTEWLEEIPGGVQISGPCIRFPKQGQFHIMKYLNGLADAIVRMGGQIYTKSRAEEIGTDGAMVNGHEIKAKYIVVATNSPINDRFRMHMKLGAYRTYVIAAKIPKGTLEPMLWWDTGDQNNSDEPYNYVRLESYDDTHDLIIIGGQDHKTGQINESNLPEDLRYESLTMRAFNRFPGMEKPIYRWSGQVIEPVDGMAYIGRNPGDDNIYIVTGDSGNGMTHGTIAGSIIRDIITGKENPYIELYTPTRSPLKDPKEFFHEAFNIAKQYGDRLTKGDIDSIKELQRNQGAILREGLKKAAVYRDEHGKCKIFSAVCPHLGCIVSWNDDEKSFDCPCHGSRFSKEGKVINGPAMEDLKQLDEEDIY